MAGFKSGQHRRRIPGSASTSLLVASYRLDNERMKSSFSGFAAMSAERMAVTDSYNKTVILFSANGTVTGRVGKGKLRGPVGICCCGQEWFVTDCGTDKQRVVVYDVEGRYLREFKTRGIVVPGAISATKNYIAVVASDTPKIVIFKPDGTIFSEITTTETEKDTRFKEFTRYETPSPSDFINPESCVFDSEENLYVTFGTAAQIVKVYKSNGECLYQMGQWQSAAGIHFSPTGKLLIAEREERRVSIRTKQGETILDAALNPTRGLNLYPHHLAVLEGNQIVVTVAQNMFSLPDIVQIFQL